MIDNVMSRDEQMEVAQRQRVKKHSEQEMKREADAPTTSALKSMRLARMANSCKSGFRDLECEHCRKERTEFCKKRISETDSTSVHAMQKVTCRDSDLNSLSWFQLLNSDPETLRLGIWFRLQRTKEGIVSADELMKDKNESMKNAEKYKGSIKKRKRARWTN